MKKYLYLALCIGGLLFTNASSAQTFSVAKDTVYASTSGTGGIIVLDSVFSSFSTSVTIYWRAIASDFPSDWISCLGICDNHLCYNNSATSNPPNKIWNGTSSYAAIKSNPYTNVGSYIELNMACMGNTNGTFYITVSLTDSANSTSSKNVTFVVTKSPVAVNNLSKSEDDIMLYPNPAHNEINIVYGAAAGVNKIKIYNMIGNEVTAFKTIDNSSARLDIDNIPAGIYFIRLINAHGEVVSTRKFTKQ